MPPAPDPQVRNDGRCAGCGKPRRFESVKPLYRAAAERDPFCSSDCARAWHRAPRTPTMYPRRDRP